MTDIEKLVKALRCCSDTSTMECSPECPRYAPEEYCGYRVREEAADVIEQLTARCARYAEEIAVMQEKGKVGRRNVDRLRAMSDEEWAEWLLKVWRAEICVGESYDLSELWCDGHRGCTGKNGRALPCSEKRLLACVLRWLRAPEDTKNAWL